MGPKNPQFRFYERLGAGVRDLPIAPAVTFLSTPRKVVEIMMLLRDDFMLLYPARL